MAGVVSGIHRGLLRVSRIMLASGAASGVAPLLMTKSPSEDAPLEMRPRSWVAAMAEVIPAGGLVVPVGSRVTCDPPVMHTDEDYLVLVKNMQEAIVALQSLGFELPKTEEEKKEYVKMGLTSQYSFQSMRFGDVNYIITEDAFFFERFLTASHVCKTLNILNKEDRITVFEAVRGHSFAREFYPEWDGKLRGATEDADDFIYQLETEVRLKKAVGYTLGETVPF